MKRTIELSIVLGSMFLCGAAWADEKPWEGPLPPEVQRDFKSDIQKEPESFCTEPEGRLIDLNGDGTPELILECATSDENDADSYRIYKKDGGSYRLLAKGIDCYTKLGSGTTGLANFGKGSGRWLDIVCDASMGIDPVSYRFDAKRGTYVQQGSGEAASDDGHGAKATTKAPTQNYVAAMKQAAQLEKKGDYRDALTAFDAALAVRPNDPNALLEAGWAAFKAGDKERARQSTTAAIAHAVEAKKKAAALYNLGRIQEDAGQKDEAIASYKQSLQLRPNATVEARLKTLESPPTDRSNPKASK